MISMDQVDLFDKIINVELIRADLTSDKIETPLEGRKPTIRLTGQYVSKSQLTDVELRVSNLYVKSPLSDYKRVRITAGYRNTLQETFEGNINLAFQELPGPDSVVNFQVILGDVEMWTTAQFAGTFTSGSSLHGIVNKISELLAPQGFPPLTVRWNIVGDMFLPANFSFTGLVKDMIPDLEDAFRKYENGQNVGVRIVPFGSTLMVFKSNLGLKQEEYVELSRITIARHNAAGFEIQAPWVPKLAPGSIVIVNPKYFRQTYGAQTKVGDQYRVILLDFDFSTTDTTNRMNLLTVAVKS